MGAALRDMRDSNRKRKALDAVTKDKTLGPLDKLKAYGQIDIPTASDYAVLLQNTAAVEKAYDPEYRELEKRLARAQASAAEGQSAASHALARYRNIEIANAQLELDMRKSMSHALAVENATNMIGAVAEARTSLVGELLRMPEDVRGQYFDLKLNELYKDSDMPEGRQIFSSVFVGPNGELDFSDEHLGTVIDKAVNSAEVLSRLAGEQGIEADDRTSAQNNFLNALDDTTFPVEQVWSLQQAAIGRDGADINAEVSAGIDEEQILLLLLQRFDRNAMNNRDLTRYGQLLDDHFASLEADPTAEPATEEPGFWARQREKLRRMRENLWNSEPETEPDPTQTPISDDLGLGGA